MSRMDHIASSSIPYRANLGINSNLALKPTTNPTQHHSQQHLMQNMAGTPEML